MAQKAARHAGKHLLRKFNLKNRLSEKNFTVAGISLSHPDRIYWDDVGVTKRELAEFYVEIWDWMRPHIVGRPLVLVRCPDGAAGAGFFQEDGRGMGTT